jgi:hypothetical protein
VAQGAAPTNAVMRGLDPRIHLTSEGSGCFQMDCRVKPGNDAE